MSSFQGDELYRTQSEISAAMQAAFQSAIPDIWLSEDGVLNIIINVEAGQIEGVFLANQIVLQDMFIQTASITGLQLWGEMLGVAQDSGSVATGTLFFSGQGGTYIGIGTEAAFDPGGGADPIYFVTTIDGTIPNPGIPTAPVATDAGTSGTLTGTYEYEISFLTDSGETVAGAASNAVVVTAHQINLASIPIGGPGTTSRRIYRSLNGGGFLLLATIADNTTTTYTDNIAVGTQTPLVVSTAQQIGLAAQGESSGSDYNAVSGAITILSNAPDGITSVINTAPFSGGSDVETSDSYRTRLLNWIRSPQTGSASDLENWALTVTGVSGAKCISNYNLSTPAPGYATVLITGANGAIATSDQISTVLALLQSKTLANITIVVASYTAQSQAVTVTVTAAAGFATSDLAPSIRVAISNYINSIPVGGTLYVSQIVAAVQSVPNVVDVVVNTPSSNQNATDSLHKFTPGTLTVN